MENKKIRIFKKNNKTLTIKDLTTMCPWMPPPMAYKRLLRWEADLWSFDDLKKPHGHFPKDSLRRRSGNKSKLGTYKSSRPRKDIDSIPSPTKFDREVVNQPLNQCLPGLANNIHNNY